VAEAAHVDPALPVAALGRNSVGWWGMLCLIATEASLFAYLLFSYGYFAVRFGPSWLPERHPSLLLALPNTVVLLASSVVVWRSETGAKEGCRRRHLTWLAFAIALGTIFVIVQLFEWKAKTYRLSTNAYGSFYFTITGFHMAHVIAGLAILSVVWLWSALGYITPRRHEAVLISSVYWHFVDVVWLLVFTAFYATPYLMGGP
jgi:heme/copper-type cytochrome/quinol oxidase subunit 3